MVKGRDYIRLKRVCWIVNRGKLKLKIEIQRLVNFLRVILWQHTNYTERNVASVGENPVLEFLEDRMQTVLQRCDVSAQLSYLSQLTLQQARLRS